MLLNTCIFNYFHPGFILPSDSRVYVGSDGVERESDAIEGALNDSRPLSRKILDPLDIRGLFVRENKASYDPIEIGENPRSGRVVDY